MIPPGGGDAPVLPVDQAMSGEKSDALVIRVSDFSETSRVTVFFTREFGRISTLAKGGRRLKGPFESALDLLSTCRIVFLRKSSSGLDILTEAQLVSRFRPHGRDLTSLYGGYYVAELLLSLTEDYDPHPVLYDAAVAALDRLSSEEIPRLSLIRFELVLLREIGQLPNFEECMACGEAVSEGLKFGFWVSQGGLICPTCQREDYDQLQIRAGTVAVLRHLADESETAWQRVSVSAQQLHEMKQVTTAAISHVLGRRPRMARYLKF
jgi:DNA repair protein RecO (recombination protein O)